MLILEVLDEVPDPRGYNSQHDLTDVLFVALAAVLCGATSCTDMALFAEGRLDLLRQFVPLGHGAPSHDTFSRVLGAVDPVAFQASFQRFAAAFGQQARYERQASGQVAVDGKGLRRAYEKGRACLPPLVATVFDCELLMSLSQSVAETGSERAAAIAALKLLSLDGAVVSADALHANRPMTQAIRQGGGHYVLALKPNNATLYKAAEAALDKAAANPRTPIFETEDSVHGRHEVRRALVTPFIQPPCKQPFVDLVAVARIESWRTKDEVTTHKVRLYALSQRISAAEVLRRVRRHWAIENELHWQLDVLFAEDLSRTRKKNGPANLAVLRRLALNVLRAEPANIPLRHKGLKARWNDQALLSLMTHMR
jgi:predicted transposase YbfD/YdcC